MKNKLLIIFSLLFILPLGVKAEAGTDVKTVEAQVSNNNITFNGTTQDDSVAVMCKLYDSNNKQAGMFSVEVENKAFTGSFVAEKTGDYTVSCANYEGGAIVSADVTVSTMATYTVTFNAKGGTLTSDASVNVTHGQMVAEPTDPEKENKVFAGWCIDETVTTLFDFSTKITANMTLYARWADPTTQVQVVYGDFGAFKVEFDTDNYNDQGTMGVFVTQSQRYFVNTGNTVTLTAEVPEGQHFVGWYTTHEEEDTNNPGNMIWTNDELLSEDQTYEFVTEGLFINIKPEFAVNQGPEMHTITFDTVGGSIIGQMEVPDGSMLNLPANPTKDDCVFVWWYEDSTYEVSFDPSKEIHGSFTLYAKWIGEDEQRDADQIQIWATPGGRVAAQYTPSEPNVYDFVTLSGNEYVENGEVVQYYINDEVTAKANPDEGFRFVGWKHANTENEIPDGMDEPPKCIGEVISTEQTYTYRPSVTVVDGDEGALRYICADFEEDNGDNPNPGGNENPAEEPDDSNYVSYDLHDDDGNEISFTEDPGQDLKLVVSDLSNLSDEVLAQMDPPMDRESYEAIKASVIEATSKYGTLISFLDISILDENNNPIEMNRPVNVKLVMSSEMMKYNTFKLVYVDVNDQGEAVLGEVAKLDVVEENGVKYLVGTVPHLSAYALMGSNEETTTNTTVEKAPKTYDGIMTWIITLGISVVCLAIILIVYKKKQKINS